jgi:hypothetical protein
MAEGFQASRALSRKFVILYKLCEDLLSKSRHYDWKLRAIKTTLYVAGGMKRAAPELTEDKVHRGKGVEVVEELALLLGARDMHAGQAGLSTMIRHLDKQIACGNLDNKRTTHIDMGLVTWVGRKKWNESCM